MLEVYVGKLTYLQPGTRSQAIRAITKSLRFGCCDTFYVMRMDGKLEVYRGTQATKQGWFKTTYDSAHTRKRPNIPQYKVVHDFIDA